MTNRIEVEALSRLGLITILARTALCSSLQNAAIALPIPRWMPQV
ncbi:hypothetical protein [[Limnothrix rosea] IAM M-220]|nr:hypothetical protein [[Limnothrix rosea] IAM M-220]